MNTGILTRDNTPCVHPFEDVVAEASRQLVAGFPGGEESQPSPIPHRPSMKSVLDTFVALLKDNPRVWAIYATEDDSGIRIWTYVDSTDRGDRSPVYAAEWQLLSRYPEVPFDFNVLLSPAGSEQLEAGSLDYVYSR